VEEMIETSKQAKEISGKEAAWLQDIVATAQAEDWESAMAMSRRMLKDQVTRR